MSNWRWRFRQFLWPSTKTRTLMYQKNIYNTFENVMDLPSSVVLLMVLTLVSEKKGLIIFVQNLSIHPIVLVLNTPAILAALIFINSARVLLFDWFLWVCNGRTNCPSLNTQFYIRWFWWNEILQFELFMQLG